MSTPNRGSLFIEPDEWTALADTTRDDPAAALLRRALFNVADAMAATPTVRLQFTGKPDTLHDVRAALSRIAVMAAAFRLTGTTRYRDRAVDQLREFVATPDWNPPHFLHVGEASFATAIGLSWLRDELTAQDRDDCIAAIRDKGLAASFDRERHGPWLWWIDRDNNWNQVCHGGLVIGALAIAEHAPELAKRTLDRALANLPAAAAAYAPDGVYPEGPGYWGYGTSYHVALIAALRHAHGTTYGLETFPGFLPSAAYVQRVITPTGGWMNTADCHENRPLLPALFWFAAELKRPDLYASEVAELQRIATAPPTAALATPYRDNGWIPAFIPLALVWHRRSLANGAADARISTVAQPDTSRATAWFGRGAQPISVMRDYRPGASAFFFGIKGGTPAHSHAHMDVGSFVLEADGVRWAVDCDIENYGAQRAAGLNLFDTGAGSDRWTIFRCGPASHSILRFDDQPQNVTGTAAFTAYDLNDPSPWTLLDLSPTYAGQAAGVSRRAHFHPPGTLVLTDEWTALDHDTEVASQWMTRATVETVGRSIHLRQAGQTLTLTVQAPPDASLSVEDPALELRPSDSPNPGLRRIVIRTRTPARGRSGITVVVSSVT